MPKFTKKPVTIEAIHYLGLSNLADVLNFTGKHPQWDAWFNSFEDYQDYVAGDNEVFKVFTLEGTMHAQPGDWIIKGVKGEFYPCKPDIFAATYDNAYEGETPDPAAIEKGRIWHNLQFPYHADPGLELVLALEAALEHAASRGITFHAASNALQFVANRDRETPTYRTREQEQE